MNSPNDPMPWPEPEKYARVVRAVLPQELANDILAEQERLAGADAGWSEIDLSQKSPITLGLIAVDRPFAEWYARRFPERAALVAEIRRAPEERALAEIRGGRWIKPARF